MSDKPLSKQIHEKLVVDEPDEVVLVDALENAVEIVNGSWRINVCEPMEKREPKDRVFTYLLAKYAAARVSDGGVSMAAARNELHEHFDRQLVKEVCEHGWVRHWDGSVQIRPNFYKHAADELARRYVDKPAEA